MHFDLSLISKYRTQLMGTAMIWIMLFHTKISITIPIITSIKSIGYAGVDVFVFLSGIGIYYSWQKEPSYKHFYQKRILRILPSYISLAILFAVIGIIFYNYKISSLIWSISSLAYIFEIFDPLITNWYIPFILFLYLITPPFFSIFSKNIVKGFWVIIIITLITYCLINLYYSQYIYLLLMISRIPIYFLGIYIGYQITKKKQLNYLETSACFLFFIFGLMILLYPFPEQIRHIFYSKSIIFVAASSITPFLCILFSKIFQMLDPHLSLVNLFGRYSLCIYIIHEKLIFICYHEINSLWIANIIITILTLTLAIFWQRASNNIIAKYRKSTKS